MTFRFSRRDDSVQDGVRRIAAEEVEEALAALDDEARPLAERIHEGRKSVKKLRGLIRLVRPMFDDYEAENDALRTAGRHLSAARGAEVALETLRKLARDAEVDADTAAAAAGLDAAHERHHDDEALGEAMAAFRADLAALARRAEGWKIAGREFAALAPGLEDTWARARKAMKRARASGDEADIHAWRKRVKDHWYQARLLEPIWPEVMAPHVEAADRLGETLGLHNDLAETAGALSDGSEASEALRAEARSRQRALLDEAVPLGRRLLAGPPEALTARWGCWWKVWRG